MLTFIIQMVLAALVSSVKNPANVTQTEWTLVEELGAACTALLAKKPADMN
jgi:hypothetical protein